MDNTLNNISTCMHTRDYNIQYIHMYSMYCIICIHAYIYMYIQYSTVKKKAM